MKFKAVIFDLDGVLVSTDEQHYQGWKALCDRLGIPFDREVNNRFRGVSRMACVDILEEPKLDRRAQAGVRDVEERALPQLAERAVPGLGHA